MGQEAAKQRLLGLSGQAKEEELPGTADTADAEHAVTVVSATNETETTCTSKTNASLAAAGSQVDQARKAFAQVLAQELGPWPR